MWNHGREFRNLRSLAILSAPRTAERVKKENDKNVYTRRNIKPSREGNSFILSPSF